MHLLFDLDGTLTDSFPGISRSINDALALAGSPCVPDAQIRALVGTPLPRIFAALLDTEDHVRIDHVVGLYRAQFDEVGILHSRLFDGIQQTLDIFRTAGHVLQVVTVRSAPSARRVVQHLAIDSYFAAVHGPDPSERACNKADLVMTALHAAGADPANSVMIGDRAEDIRAARANGVRAIAVGWGYGAAEELSAARPDFHAASTADLVRYVATAGVRS